MFKLTSRHENDETEIEIFMISVSIQPVSKMKYFNHFFKMYSLHAVQELLADKEKVCCKAEQDNAGDTRVDR
jgi:hypothetical protein